MQPAACFEAGRFTQSQSSWTALCCFRKWMSGRADALAQSATDRKRQIVQQLVGPTAALQETLPSAGGFLFSLDKPLSSMSRFLRSFSSFSVFPVSRPVSPFGYFSETAGRSILTGSVTTSSLGNAFPSLQNVIRWKRAVTLEGIRPPNFSRKKLASTFDSWCVPPGWTTKHGSSLTGEIHEASKAFFQSPDSRRSSA